MHPILELAIGQPEAECNQEEIEGKMHCKRGTRKYWKEVLHSTAASPVIFILWIVNRTAGSSGGYIHWGPDSLPRFKLTAQSYRFPEKDIQRCCQNHSILLNHALK